MKKVFGLLLLIVFASTLAGCLDGKAEKKIFEKTTVLLPGAGFSIKPALLSLNDQELVLLGEKRGVTLYIDGKEKTISPDIAGNQWLHYDGKQLYAFWWSADQNKAKSLKVAVSSDMGQTFSKPAVINSNTGVLPDISIATDGSGRAAIGYTDEREPGYGVYLNYSSDAGLTWQSNDARLDSPVLTPAMLQEGNTKPATFANSPKLAFVNGKLVAVWQQVDVAQMNGHILRIVSKTSLDGGKSWGELVNVYSAPNVEPVEMTMFSNAKEVYVFAMLTEENKGFTGFYNNDENFSTWTAISNEPLGAGFNQKLVSWIKATFSGENLILAYTAEPKEQESSKKVHAEVATLSTKSHSWLGAARVLDADKGHTLTRSTYPDIVSVGPDSVYVVWEDYRTLAPSIYVDISRDNGKTWLPKTLPLTTPGLAVAKDPRLLVGSNKLMLNYFMVELNGTNPNGQRVYQTLAKEGDGFTLPNIQVPTFTPEEMKSKLVDRANKFWALREEAKWEETWDYMDPVYRERFEKDSWVKQQGRINFTKTVVDESSVVVTGNIGILDANVELNVQQQVSKEGLLESAPPQQQKVGMRWGWFYDDWYFMPKVIFGEHMDY